MTTVSGKLPSAKVGELRRVRSRLFAAYGTRLHSQWAQWGELARTSGGKTRTENCSRTTFHSVVGGVPSRDGTPDGFYITHRTERWWSDGTLAPRVIVEDEKSVQLSWLQQLFVETGQTPADLTRKDEPKNRSAFGDGLRDLVGY
jgi:hypothetical protein